MPYALCSLPYALCAMLYAPSIRNPCPPLASLQAMAGGRNPKSAINQILSSNSFCSPNKPDGFTINTIRMAARLTIMVQWELM